MEKNRETVLIVDDEPENLSVLNDHLDSMGFEVLVAKNGEEALKRAIIAVPDIILLDVLTPEINGIETCRRIKSDETTSDIPVIFLTALEDMEIKIKGFEAGAVDFITKPFHIREISARLETHLSLRRMQRELVRKNKQLQQEIENHHRTEKALRSSEAQKQAILDGITTNIAFVNENMEILWVNKAAAESVRRTPHSMIGRRCYEFWGDFEKPCTSCPAVKAFQTRKTEHVTITTPDGRIWDEKGEPVFDASENLIGVVEIAEDITDRKRAEQQLQEYSNRLEEMVKERTAELQRAQKELLEKERLAVLGHFAGSISHEIRNPLAVIDGSVYILKTKADKSDERLQRHLERIGRNVKKCTNIIESLLNLSRMKKPVEGHCNLVELVLESIHGGKIPHSVETVTNFPENPVFINADREQIRMALKNIIQNAKQAINRAGTITVAVRRLKSESVEIAISDSGPGIASENLERVFEPLFTTKTHGIGFGLSITKMIIENHGGSIRAESTPGSGAEFIATIPVAERPAY